MVGQQEVLRQLTTSYKCITLAEIEHVLIERSILADWLTMIWSTLQRLCPSRKVSGKRSGTGRAPRRCASQALARLGELYGPGLLQLSSCLSFKGDQVRQYEHDLSQWPVVSKTSARSTRSARPLVHHHLGRQPELQAAQSSRLCTTRP